ncbi:MAG: ABC transporter permease [Cyanobacteria bacterium]|nr:ABC transporter permease [Cyanobacteriota bacterium]
MLQDLRLGFRRVRHSIGFSFAVIIILSIGVAAATTMGSVLYALAYRPLTLPDAGKLVTVGSYDQQHFARTTPLTTVDHLRRADLPVDGWCAQSSTLDAVESGGRILEANIDMAITDCQRVIGVAPILGRWFTSEETPLTGSGAAVVVITDRFWKRMFDSASDVVGKTVRIRDINATVIGVMPPLYEGFSADTISDFIIPFNAHRPASGSSRYIAKLHDGVSLATLRAQVKTMWPALLEAVMPQGPTREQSLKEWSGDAERITGGFSILRRLYAEPVRRMTLLTVALLTLVMVNVGGLMIARLSGRVSEISAMRAMGASTGRIVLPLATEGVILALLGTMLSVPLAIGASSRFSALFPSGNMPWTIKTTPDTVVFAAVSGGFIVLALVISIVPIWLVARRPAKLRASRSVSRASSRWAQAFLIAQVAVTLALVFTCGLVVRSFYDLQSVDRGFRADHLLTLRLSANPGGYKDMDAASYYRSLVQRMQSLPGVQAAGLARYFGTINTTLPGSPVGFADRTDTITSAAMDFVSPGFFQTIGVPLQQGRDLQWTDLPSTPKVVVVSETVARALDPTGNVIGRVIRYGTTPAYAQLQIVGVIGNISIGNLRRTADPMIYTSSLQVGETAFGTLHMRTTPPPMELANAASAALASMGREHTLGVYDDVLFGNSVVAERMGTAVSGIVATLAVIVSCIGLFALLSHTVERRTREIGIRVAVGASPAAVSQFLLRHALVLVAVGIAIGIPGALFATSLVRSLLFGVSDKDIPTLAMTIGVLGVASLAAAVQPILKAIRLDPVIALRSE